MNNDPPPDEPTPAEEAAALPGGYAGAVSLGGDCRIAQQLRVHGLRPAALPFDWVITPFPALYALLADGFDGLLHPDHLEAVPYGVKDVRYGVEFRHDFPPGPDFLRDHPAVAAKYRKRSRRLVEVLESPGPVLLVRDGLCRAEAVALTGLLARRFPRLRYDLLGFIEVPVGAAGPGGAAVGPDWGLPGVRTFRVAPPMAGMEHPWSLFHAYARVFYFLGLSRVPESHRMFLFNPFAFAARLHAPPLPPLRAGSLTKVPVTVTNAGPVGWPATGHPLDVQVGQHWRRADGTVYDFEGVRTPLPHPLPAGGSAVVPAGVQAPREPGRYVLHWDLVIDRVVWFSERGLRGPAVEVEVVG